MEDELHAAVRRFPRRHLEIETLAAGDEEFRLLCEDLTEAEAAVVLWSKSASPHRDKRVAEYNALIGGLAAEIEAALNSKSVVPFTRHRHQ